MTRQSCVESFLDELEPHLSYRETKIILVTEFERIYLTRLLARTRGNIAVAARSTRMDRKHLNELVKKHGLKRDNSTRRDSPSAQYRSE